MKIIFDSKEQFEIFTSGLCPKTLFLRDSCTVADTCEECWKQAIEYEIKGEVKMSINEQIVRLYENGYKLKEIAEELGLTVAAVSSRLQRIRKTREVKRKW